MTPDMLVSVLTWIAVGLGTVVIGLLSWFAVRIVGQLDHVTDLLVQQNTAFKEEIHRQDLRIARLEVWREGNGRPLREADK